jgi:phospholipid/cholesterol/gamma-HCH transport system ATP-binding protein
MKSAKHTERLGSSPVGDGETMIEFDNVVKILGGRRILDGVSFTVRRGETFVVCGPSGVGKSVTLKHMVRLLTPDEGDVRVAGESISGATGRQLSRLRDRFGYLFQGGALLAWLSVAENVELPLREKTTLSEGEIRERVQRVLEMVELGGEGDKRPSEISGGMRKRAGLARAIVMDPEIVLYDEPTSGLDPVTSRTIDALIERLRVDIGVTSVVVTHDLHSALSIGTRIAMLNKGGIQEISTPEEFVRSDNPDVKLFLKSQFITTAGAWEKSLSRG